jgi:hypothetical protein
MEKKSMLLKNSVENNSMTKKIVCFLVLILFTGCASRGDNEKEMISVLDINKKIQELESRMTKTEKRVEEFSAIALALSKKEQMEFPIDETSKLAQTYISVEVVNRTKREPLVPTKQLDSFLFVNNLDKKIYDFKRTPFEVKRNAIVYNKKGDEVLLLRKGTIVESSFRINKYFQIDAYNFKGDYYMPNTELFLSEEVFLD